MAADVRKGAHLAVVAADDDHALAEIFDGPPFAGLDDFALVADDLRRGTQERALLRLQELRVEVEPAGQAHVLQRVRRGFNGAEVRGHYNAISTPSLLGEGMRPRFQMRSSNVRFRPIADIRHGPMSYLLGCHRRKS